VGKCLKNILILVFLLSGTINQTFSSDLNPKKHALIIAVGNYPSSTQWTPISSTTDIELIFSSLTGQGFKEEDIRILRDQEATKRGILEAFTEMIEETNQGDIILIHFSGHGQQIADDNGEELDGFDEAFIPYDAQKYYQKNGYHGENHLRDDEIGSFLKALAEKAAPDGDILVLMDACHSGTGSRGYCPARGTLVRFGERETNYIYTQKETTCFLDQSFYNPSVSLNIISASGANELNYEYIDATGNSCGSLSYAFSKCFSDIKPEMTYRSLFQQLLVEMATITPRQNPQLEGSKDNKLFGGESVLQKPYFTINHQIDSCTLVVDCGKVSGVFDSSILVFYPAGTLDPNGSNPIAKGVVTNASMLTCNVRLQDPIPVKFTASLWGFLAYQNLGELKTRIFFEPNITPEIKLFIQNELEQSILIEYTNTPSELIISEPENEDPARIEVYSSNDYLLCSEKIDLIKSELTAKRIVSVIKQDAQVNLLKRINQDDEEIQVILKLVKGDQPCYSFTVGDTFRLRIINTGEKNAYYNILDIQPDNIINAIMPGICRVTPDECFIEAGDSIDAPYPFTINPPCGKETMLLIASSKPMNLEFLTRTRGGNTSEELNPFELLYKESFSQTRSKGIPDDIPTNAVSIYKLVFDIAKESK